MDGNLFHTPDDSYTVQVLLSLPYNLLAELNGCLSYGAMEDKWLQVGGLTPAECSGHFDRMIMEKRMLTGSILYWFGQELPDWGLLCDGSTYSKDDYPGLWAVIVDGFKTTTEFTVPNLTQMFIQCIDNPSETGDVQGNWNHEATIQVQNLPPHTHTTDNMAGIVNGGALASLPVHVPGVGVTGSAGSGVALDIMPRNMYMMAVIVI